MPTGHAIRRTTLPTVFQATVQILFWLLVAAVTWCYAGYPLFVAAQARFRARPYRRPTSRWQPAVSVVVAVRNERATLLRRVENLLAQEYPADRLTVVIACNGSIDGTYEMACELARTNTRVRVVSSPAELGKAGALNLGVAEAKTAEVIVFADARQTFEKDVVSLLSQPLADSEVGVVSGRLIIPRADLAPVEGVRLYWGMEMRLRDAESRSGSVVQALGAIYAVRRSLFEPVPANLILDDVYVAMRIAMKGQRVIMVPAAIGYDTPAGDRQSEYSRKRRTMVGNIQLLRALPALLSPTANPLFFRFVSHKLLRVCSPFCFVAILGLSALLSQPFYRAVFVAELTLYLTGMLGLLVSLPALSVPSAFVLMHAAIFAAAWRWRQNASVVWQPRQSSMGREAVNGDAFATANVPTSRVTAVSVHQSTSN